MLYTRHSLWTKILLQFHKIVVPEPSILNLRHNKEEGSGQYEKGRVGLTKLRES